MFLINKFFTRENTIEKIDTVTYNSSEKIITVHTTEGKEILLNVEFDLLNNKVTLSGSEKLLENEFLQQLIDYLWTVPVAEDEQPKLKFSNCEFIIDPTYVRVTKKEVIQVKNR